MDALLKNPVSYLLLIAVVTLVWKSGAWYGQVNSDRKSFKEFMKEIKDDISGIRDNIQKIFDRLPPPPTAASASPAQLTDFGEKVARGIDAHAWASSTAKTILDNHALLSLKPYQIESFCQSYVERGSEKGGVLEEKVQIAIYEFGIDRDSVLPVLRIPLREALLKRQEALRAARPV